MVTGEKAENQELYELVSTLEEHLAQCHHHIKELGDIITSTGDDLAIRVNELTKMISKYERSLIAKQVFSENLLKENKKLKDLLEKHEIVDVVNLQTLDISEDLRDGHVSNNAQVSKDQSVPVRTVLKEENERLKARIEDQEKSILEFSSKNLEMREEIEKLNKKIAELTSELEKANDVVKTAQTELNETTKKCTDLQKKCAGFFKQVISLTDSLKNYEEDFRRENEDKVNFEKKWRTSQQENERLKRENQSHMATIRYLETKIEIMFELLNDEGSRKNNGRVQSPFSHAFGTSASRSIFQDRGPPAGIVVADGAGVNESESSGQRNQNSTLIECPYCSRSYPYHLIEGHAQDCMEDMLYMDDY